MSRITAIALSCVLSSGLITLPAMAANETATASTPSTIVYLSAQGEVATKPDMATLSFGVVTEGATADEAISKNRDQMTAALDALKKMGIESKAIVTSGLNLNPRYTNGSGLSTIRGYQAANQVTVRIEDLSKVGQSVDAVVKSGVNQVRGLRFGLKDESQSEDVARRMAIKALTERAELYAQSLGMKVKALRALTEGGSLPQNAYDVVVVTGNRRASATPVSEGELGISITVTGQFELTK